MNKSMSYAPEVRERAVQVAPEHRGEYASEWAALTSMVSKIGCPPQSLGKGVGCVVPGRIEVSAGA